MATNGIRYYAQQRECIDYFREEYEFLSNFYPARLTFDGVSYDNSEAAFQAQKCIDPAQRPEFSHLYANQAKRKGRKVALRPDWEQVKLSLMEKILYAKFSQNPVLAQRLLDTGDTPLKEGNTWHDYYWGVDLKSGKGQNHLGILLMELRSRFQREGIPDLPTAPVRRFGPVGGITITDEDITQLAVDCIVNAANTTLLGGGGVDGAIHREAGPGLLEECRTLDGCRPGEAKLTGGYRLKAKHIIHTVGPVYGKDDDSLLGVCYLNCMELARQNDLHSIAFPAISTGRFCFPKDKAAHIAVTTLQEWQAAHPDYPMEILLSCMDYHIFEMTRRELEE